jgi:hypothetical protein
MQFAIVKTDVAKLRRIVFLLTGVFIVITAASGYLYHQNKSYQFENQRLIIVNDSILSENLELKNSLRQKSSTVLKSASENIKKKEIK